MKKAICTLAIGSVGDQYLKILEPTMREYAEKFGWDVHILKKKLVGGNPKKSKFIFIRRLMDEYDYVWFIDADTKFMRYDRDIIDEIADDEHWIYVVIRKTSGWMNSGSVLYKVCDISKEFIDEASKMAISRPDKGLIDQPCITRLLGFRSKKGFIEETKYTSGYKRMDEDWNAIKKANERLPESTVLLHYHRFNGKVLTPYYRRLAVIKNDVLLKRKNHIYYLKRLDKILGEDEEKWLNFSFSKHDILLRDAFVELCNTEHDIQEHLERLKNYSSKCETVTEFGVRTGRSTIAFLMGKPKKMVSYDIRKTRFDGDYWREIVENNTDFEFKIGDSKKITIKNTDLLFIDTKHTYDHLTIELNRHHKSVNKWIILHDTSRTEKRWVKGNMYQAVADFIKRNPEWKIIYHTDVNNGLTIMERIT